MHTLFEILPLIVFIAAYKLKGIYIATALLMLITIAQSIWIYYKYKKLNIMQWITLVLVCGFGAATLLLHDERFIKIKPTILYWLFAVALEISWRAYKKNLAENLLKPMLEKSDIYINKPQIWIKTHHFCAAFFWAVGLINLVIAYNYSLDIWVSMKAYGFPILTMLSFGVLLFWLVRHKDIHKPNPNLNAIDNRLE